MATSTRTRPSANAAGGDQRFRTIVAKHPGKCRRCGGPIRPGDAIRWAPKRGTYHYKDYCGGEADELAMARSEEVYGPDAPVDGGFVTTPTGERVYVPGEPF